MNTTHIPSTRDLALICAKQLIALLNKPEFDIGNPHHMAAADHLWLGALLARQQAKGTQS